MMPAAGAGGLYGDGTNKKFNLANERIHKAIPK